MKQTNKEVHLHSDGEDEDDDTMEYCSDDEGGTTIEVDSDDE